MDTLVFNSKSEPQIQWKLL